MNYIDTDKIKEKGDKIVKYANDYKQLINKLFNIILCGSNIDQAWVGEAADKYKKIISLDKEDYLDFGDNIKKFGNYLQKYAKESDNTIASIKKKEALK